MSMRDDGVAPSMQEASKSFSYKLFLFSFLQGVANGIWGFARATPRGSHGR